MGHPKARGDDATRRARSSMTYRPTWEGSRRRGAVTHPRANSRGRHRLAHYRHTKNATIQSNRLLREKACGLTERQRFRWQPGAWIWVMLRFLVSQLSLPLARSSSVPRCRRAEYSQQSEHCPPPALRVRSAGLPLDGFAWRRSERVRSIPHRLLDHGEWFASEHRSRHMPDSGRLPVACHDGWLSTIRWRPLRGLQSQQHTGNSGQSIYFAVLHQQWRSVGRHRKHGRHAIPPGSIHHLHYPPRITV